MVISMDHEDGDLNLEFPLDMDNGRTAMKVWIGESGVGLKFRLHHNTAELLKHQYMYTLTVDGNDLVLTKFKNSKEIERTVVDSL